MNQRKLRIAWSVGWGVVAVLLCVLWLRSYWRQDRIEGPWFNSSQFHVWSVRGELIYRSDTQPGHWEFQTIPREEGNKWSSYWGWKADAFSRVAYIPHHTSVVFFATLASLPWLPRRFSLRTLLIATTLIAVLLGLVVWGRY